MFPIIFVSSSNTRVIVYTQDVHEFAKLFMSLIAPHITYQVLLIDSDWSLILHGYACRHSLACHSLICLRAQVNTSPRMPQFDWLFCKIFYLFFIVIWHINIPSDSSPCMHAAVVNALHENKLLSHCFNDSYLIGRFLVPTPHACTQVSWM